MSDIHDKPKTREQWVEEAIEAIENASYSFAIFASIIKDKLK